MRPAYAVVVLSIVVGLAVTPDHSRAAQRAVDPTLSELLAASGRYVADYEASFGAVIAEERLVQSERLNRRFSTGDMLLFNSGGAGWMAFRAIREVDNATLPTPPGRLEALVTNPTRDALAEAMRATAESATYFLGTIPRAATIPTSALTYLRPTRQSLGAFELDGMKTVDKVRVAVLKFSERPHARMTAADDFIIMGRFWVVPETGRVVQTELDVTSAAYESRVEVEYSSQPGIGLWAPVRMFEQYTLAAPSSNSPANLGRFGGASPTVSIDGLTTYQAFRRFDLKPGLVIK